MSPWGRLLVVGAIMGPHVASAAPFCMILLGTGPQCIYYDAGQCQKDAAKQGATCAPNTEGGAAQTSASGSGQYCLALSNGANLCHYYNYESCNADAAKQNGACWFDGTKAAGVANPYAVSNPVATPNVVGNAPTP